jgi:hypothetical protein
MKLQITESQCILILDYRVVILQGIVATWVVRINLNVCNSGWSSCCIWDLIFWLMDAKEYAVVMSYSSVEFQCLSFLCLVSSRDCIGSFFFYPLRNILDSPLFSSYRKVNIVHFRWLPPCPWNGNSKACLLQLARRQDPLIGASDIASIVWTFAFTQLEGEYPLVASVMYASVDLFVLKDDLAPFTWSVQYLALPSRSYFHELCNGL